MLTRCPSACRSPALSVVLAAWLAGLVPAAEGPAAPTSPAPAPLGPRPADLTPDIVGRAPWRPLWDGKTLDGWHAIGKGRWTLEDGALVGRHDPAEPEFSHLVTNALFRDFLVRVRYKALKGNSGLYFRIEETGASGVSGFQAEIDPAQDAGGLYETNGRAWVVKPSPEQVRTWYKPGEWNEMTVSALGRHVAVHVNGLKSAELADDPGRLEGRLALQVHGGQDVEVMFKDIEIATWADLLPGPGLAGCKQPAGDWAVAAEAAADPANEKALAVRPGEGVLYNGPKGRTANLFTATDHGDAAVHLEFLVPKGSNSGVYFQGRYEIQIYDSHGVAKDKYPGIECGGIYERWDPARGPGREGFEGRSPRVNASLPPGRWQTFDVVFQAPRFDASGRKTAHARFVKVYHNGHLIHENVEVTGPTRAAAFADEKPLGPLMLQGDHGPVAYRNLRVLPLAP